MEERDVQGYVPRFFASSVCRLDACGPQLIGFGPPGGSTLYGAGVYTASCALLS